jgi:hypothetical protein
VRFEEPGVGVVGWRSVAMPEFRTDSFPSRLRMTRGRRNAHRPRSWTAREDGRR